MGVIENMKIIKPLKIVDFIISILCIVAFLYTYRITENYEYALGQMIALICRLPVLFLLFVSMIFSAIAVLNKKSLYLFSMLSQISKIAASLSNFVISEFILHVTFRPSGTFAGVYAIIVVVILLIVMFQRRTDHSAEKA